MATIPPAFTDAVNQLAADKAALDASYADQQAKRQAEAAAVQLRQAADNTVAANATALEADKSSIKQLLDALFPSTPPAPAPPPDAPPGPPA